VSDDMENLLSIGEFATASRISQKALRLYAEKGLLAPAWVDPSSGYRYYRVAQLRKTTVISLLRRAGMSLVDIRAFLSDPSLERLDELERRAVDELAERRQALHHLQRVLKEEHMFDVLTKRVDEQPYVSRSKRVLVPDLEPYIRTTFEEFGEPEGGRPFVLYHGAVNTEEDGPVEVCVPKRAGDRSLPSGEVAFTEISGRQCDFPEILGAYEAVYRWASEHGREADGPPREIYHTELDEDLKIEIALPLR
jgi:DNA-binding transcriptional MerR regulator